MNNTLFTFPKPENEPVLGYKPGSAERKEIRKALDELYNMVTDIPAIIGGKEVRTAETGTLVMPTDAPVSPSAGEEIPVEAVTFA